MNAHGILSAITATLKVSGIWPFRERWIQEKTGNGSKFSIRLERCRFWYSMSTFLLAITVIHTLWAPTMLIRLEKSIMIAFAKSRNASVNITPGNNVNVFASKQTMVVKVVHPLLICATSLTARTLSVFTLSNKIPNLLMNVKEMDNLLMVPREIHRRNGVFLLLFYAVFILLNVPLMGYHLWQLSMFHSGWGNAWEAFSMFNIFSAFAMELEFIMLCYIVRSRLLYVNNKLNNFVDIEYIPPHQFGKIFASSSIADPRLVSEMFERVAKMDIKRGGWDLRPRRRTSSEGGNSIRCLRKAHLILHDIMEHINGIYQLQLLVSIFASISKILFNLYFSIFGFITSSKALPTKFHRGQMYIVCSWTAYYCLRFLFIVIFAHAAVKEYKKTKGILVKIDDRIFDDAQKEEKKMFWDHVSCRNFEFSACGLFDLNMALITSAFSSGITYLVIMAQFH